MKELFTKMDTNSDGAVELTEWLDNLPKGARLKVLGNWVKNNPDKVLKKADAGGNLIKMKMPEVKVMYTYTDEVIGYFGTDFCYFVQSLIRVEL